MTISSATAVGTAPTSQSANIGIQDFLKILTTQLNNQDPLKPVDNQEFVAQIAQFATLEQSRQLNEKIDGLLTAQSTTQTLGLLGKTVDVEQDGGTATGTVIGIKLNGSQPLLTIRQANSGAVLPNITLAQVVTVR